VAACRRSSSLLARTAALKLAESKPLPPLPMAKLVDCLVKLGGIAEAQLTLRRHMPIQVLHMRASAHQPPTITFIACFPAQRQGESADKLCVKAANSTPCWTRQIPSKAQSMMGTVLSIAGEHHPPLLVDDHKHSFPGSALFKAFHARQDTQSRRESCGGETLRLVAECPHYTRDIGKRGVC
jgi:hypothetical protein